MTVLELALKLVLTIAVGYAARKLKIMPDGFDKTLTRFVMAIPLPCMIVNSFNIDFSMDDLLNCPVILGLSLLSIAITTAIGHLIFLKMGKTGAARVARFSLVYTNFTFFGLAVVSELFGAQGVFYYVIFTLPIRIGFYGCAPLMLGSGNKLNVKETAKKFISEPVVAVFIGFLLYVTQLRLPAVISGTISSLGAMASPLGLMLCGTIIADAKWSGILKYPSVFWISLLRLVVLPAFMLGLFLLLRVDSAIIRTTVYYFAMPVPSLLPTFCLRYNPEDQDSRIVSGYTVVASTLFCIATIPLWALVMEHIPGL